MKRSYSVRLVLALALALPAAALVPAAAFANLSLGQILPQARDGDARAAYMAGMMYAFGQGVRQNVSEGARWLGESARRGLPQAMVSLASLYDVGQGVPLDTARAHALREQAAGLGDPTARGQLDDNRRLRGQADFRRASVLTDLHMEQAAVPYARRAAAQGSANAQLLLGRAYQFGSGVPRDYGQAVALYRQAVDGGLPEGARHLAYMYEFGLGVRPDRAKALTYYDRAAAGGLSKARQAAANLRSPDYYRSQGGGGRGGSGGYGSGSGSSADNNGQACANRGGTMSYGSCQVYGGGSYTKVDPNTGQREGPE